MKLESSGSECKICWHSNSPVIESTRGYCTSLPSAPSAPGYSARLAAGRAVQAAGLAVRRLDTIHHLAERAVAGRLVRSLHQPEEDAAPGKFPRVTAGTRLCRTKAQKIDLLTFDEVSG